MSNAPAHIDPDRIGEWADCQFETWSDWAWSAFRIHLGAQAEFGGPSARSCTGREDDAFERWLNGPGHALFIAGHDPKTVPFDGLVYRKPMNHYVAIEHATALGRRYWVKLDGADGKLRGAQERARSMEAAGYVAVVHSELVR